MNKGHCIFLTCCFDQDNVYSPLRPLGAYLCAHYLEQNGYECDVIDFIECFNAEDLFKVLCTLIKPNTIFIGVSNTFLTTGNGFVGKLYYKEDIVDLKHRTHTYQSDLLNVIFLVKQKFPKIKFVVGGAKASYLGHRFFDCAIHGFGENLILEYADWLIGRNPFLKYTMDQTWPNTMVVKEANNPKFNIKHSNFYFQKKHCILPEEALPLEISRGCIFKCKFCGYPATGKRKGEFVRDSGCIVNELINNYQNSGTTKYWFCDETFNDDTEKLIMLSDLVSKLPFKIEFIAYIRLDLLRAHREQIKLLEDIGLRSCFFGVETFSKKAGSIIGKGLTGEPCKEMLLELKERWDPKNITFKTSFIVGLPGDTLESQYETQQWNIDNKMKAWVFSPLMVLSPKIHGGKIWLSEFEKNPEKYGFTFPKDDPFYWENDYTNYSSACEVANELRREFINHVYSTDWHWIGLSNLGYTEEEKNNLTRSEILNSVKFTETRNDMGNRYKKLLCDYYNIIL
jgi:hypothetical protein